MPPHHPPGPHYDHKQELYWQYIFMDTKSNTPEEDQHNEREGVD